MHPIVLLSLNSQLASLLLFPIWLLRDGIAMWHDFSSIGHLDSPSHYPDSLFLILLLLSGAFSFVQNICAFALIHQLTTLSYSVSSAAKRIFVIFLSLVTLHNPVTMMNVCGMVLSVVGVFAYNRVILIFSQYLP